MFARYLYNRRNNSNGDVPSLANAGAIPLTPPPSVSKQRRRRRSERGNNGGGGGGGGDSGEGSSLEELRLALDRLDCLIAKIAPPPPPPSAVAPPCVDDGDEENNDDFFAQKESVSVIDPYSDGIRDDDRSDGSGNGTGDDERIKGEAAAPGADEEGTAGVGVASETATNYPVQKNADVSTSTTPTITNNVEEKIVANNGNNDKSTRRVLFLQVEQSDEFEIIELLRRIAELVVLSERRAGKILYDAASSVVVTDANNIDDDGDGVDDDGVVGKDVVGSERVITNILDGGSGTARTETSETTGEVSRTSKVIHRNQRLPDYNEDEALPFLAAFDLFCERNSFAKIVEIVTGAAFSKQEPPSPPQGPTYDIDGDLGRLRNHRLLLLPPISIATQALQSISILIQNVSRATSLYFLLSNNFVNDLIRLPLDSYRLALMSDDVQQLAQNSKKSAAKAMHPDYRQQSAQSEISELITHFVSFLKSLAMRMNAETVQFFLSFSDLNDNNNISPTVVSPPEEQCDKRDDSDDCEKLSSISRFQSTAVYDQQVDFPLYAGALELCALSDRSGQFQDPFVTVTAMNICMNILRLVTIHNNDKSDDTTDDQSISIPISTPTGFLHENPPVLPIQDCIAIAKFACSPTRVSDLISPLCTRLTSRFGQVEEFVRMLLEVDRDEGKNANKDGNVYDTSMETKQQSERDQQHTARAAAETTKRRMRLTSALRDHMADVQDELLLLDDLLKVGLVSLNEQTIEMVLATFVYPMLLQPLLLLMMPQQTHVDSVTAVGAVGNEIKKFSTPQSSSRFSSPLEVAEMSDNVGESLLVDITPSDRIVGGNNSIDLAPAKTALYGLSLVFNTITNTTFRYLLLTALFHPLSASVGLAGEKNTEANQVRVPPTKMDYQFQQDVANVYSFGMKTHWKNGRGSDQVEGKGGKVNSNSNIVFDTNDYVGDARNQVFVLAPGLLYLLQNVHKTTHMRFEGDSGRLIVNENDNTPSSFTITTRVNPFRKVLFSLISGASGVAALQPLATAALQAAVLSVDSSIIRMIVFSSTEVGRNDIDSSFNSTSTSKSLKEETMKCLCLGIVNTFMKDGWCKVKFNTVTAQTLMAVISNDFDCIRLASKILANIRQEAANILMRFPSQMDAKSREEMEISIVSDAENIIDASNMKNPRSPVDKEHLDHWLLDRFFFDHADKSTISVVENLCYLKEHTGSNDQVKERYRYGLEVLTTISMAAISALLCENSPVVDKMAPDESNVSTPFYYSTTWALACLYLDAFCVKLTKMCDHENVISSLLLPEQNVAVPRQQLSYISQMGTSNKIGNLQDVGPGWSSLAHISSKFAIALLDDGESLESKAEHNSNNTLPPVYGSVVELLGKSAFPCVCEVPRASSNLFTGQTCISNEGIQWQSLYLVVVGRWAVLAEPGHSGTGGEGRVITSCRLACLSVKKDASVSVNTKTPARRLLVTHTSLDPHPPSLFSADSTSSSSIKRGGDSGGPNQGQNGLRMKRSRMDLWFEDETSASHACKIISNKIAKARTRRGARIKTALLTR